MKKNRLFVLGIITMFVAILSLTLVSGTMARYTSQVSGESEARVAKWHFTLNGDDVTTSADATQTVAFDLFETIKDSDGTSDEEDVKDGGVSENIIAPGTSGKFQLVIENKSEVNATYAIDYTITNGDDIPVEFSLDGTSWNSSLADVTETVIAMGTGAATYTIYWQWAIDGDDKIDTDLGLVGTATIKVEVKITFTQKD